MNNSIIKIKKRLIFVEQEITKMKPNFYALKDTKEFWIKWKLLKQEKRELNVKIAKLINEK